MRLFALTLIGNLFFKELCYDTLRINHLGCFVAVSAAKKPNLTHFPSTRQHLAHKLFQQTHKIAVLQRFLIPTNFKTIAEPRISGL